VKVNKIVIVGGGSAGWMTAAALVKRQPNIDLTLIESANTPTIGVGESTLAWINKYFDIIGVEDEDWMEECQATYKNSIKFTNWTGDKESKPFHYPFGAADNTLAPNGWKSFMDWKLNDPTVKNHHFAEFFNPALRMSNKNKMTNNEFNELPGFDFKYDTAYHMDATLFGQYLKNNICLKSNMKYIVGHVESIPQKDDGSIKLLKLENGEEITADLFIDCTGFQSLLLGKTLGVPFASYKNTLINDKAIAAQIPYIDKEKEMESTTNCTAIENGWCWNTPLFNRIGTGYVYSSEFSTKEQAEKDFIKHLSSDNMVIGDKERAEKAKLIHIDMKTGIHEKVWEKNVVAIGLSAGFIEPLESTGLLAVHENIIYLLKTLESSGGVIGSLDRKNYNFVIHDVINQFAIFVSQHYALSTKRDTPYWKHVTENIEYDGNLTSTRVTHEGFLDTYKEIAWSSLMDGDFTFNTANSGLPYIIMGFGKSPYTSLDRVNDTMRYGWKDDNWKSVKEGYIEHISNSNKVIDKMQTHYEFLRKNIYNGET